MKVIILPLEHKWNMYLLMIYLGGISESGFFAFDNQLNYQYKAFGIPALGFKRGLKDELVISPYSTFLALKFNYKKAIKKH